MIVLRHYKKFLAGLGKSEALQKNPGWSWEILGKTNNNVANEDTRHQQWSDQEDKLLKIEVKKQKFQGG